MLLLSALCMRILSVVFVFAVYAIVTSSMTCYNEALEARSAKHFFLGFPRKKKPLHNGSCEACRVPFFYFPCKCVCIIQHRNRPLRSTALNAHGTNGSPDGLCTRTHTNEAFSCWFCCKLFRVHRARRGNVCLEVWLGRV